MVLAKKNAIQQNWRKLGPIWIQNQNYDLFDKTWRKLGLKKYFNLKWSIKVLLDINLWKK